MKLNNRQTKSIVRRPRFSTRGLLSQSEREHNEIRESSGDADERISKMYQIGGGL